MKNKSSKEEITSVMVEHFGKEGIINISLLMLLKNYSNRYVWSYILIDMIYYLQLGHRAFYRIEDDIESENFKDYPSTDYLLEHGILSMTTNHAKRLIVDLVRETWSYNGILSIYCCSDSCSLNTYKDDFQYKIKPYNDGEAIEISYPSSTGIAIKLNEIIHRVVAPYGISVDYKSL